MKCYRVKIKIWEWRVKSTLRSSVYAVLVAQNVTGVLAFATLEQKTALAWTKQIHVKTHNFESLLTWIVRHFKITEYQMRNSGNWRSLFS